MGFNGSERNWKWAYMGTRKPINWVRNGSCIIYTGKNLAGPKRSRYPYIGMGGKKVKIHRLVCERRHGPPKPGDMAMHSCDNKLCINPDHITWGTNQDNLSDASSKRLMRHGENHKNAKINNKIAMEIFQAEGTFGEIARRFGLFYTSVKLIKLKKSWAHIHDPQ